MKCHCLKCDPENKGGWGRARRALHIELLHDAPFEEWVKFNYEGKAMLNIPKNFDSSKETYYKIDGKQYGPIKLDDIPERYRGS